MKSFLVFLLLLAGKALFGCGFYPYPEETRFFLFNPQIFGYYGYERFHYSAMGFTSSYYPDSTRFPAGYVEPNTKLWFEYCRGKVDIPSIQSAVYELSKDSLDENAQNAMIRYLYDQKDTDALNYLRFAKKCEFFNSWMEDPWEREPSSLAKKREELMDTAIKLSEQVKNKELKRRYAFLAIRLGWYNNQREKVQALFESVFANTAQKDILYHWALYFRTNKEQDRSLANFGLAQVFAHAVDKRIVCHMYYNRGVSVEQMLQHAKTNEEKANVYLLDGIERHDKVLSYLKQMYALHPESEGLSFLLLREINKIEDFVFTPYYTLFQPSLSYGYWSGNGKETSIRQTLNRAERDREYAREVLAFVNSVDLRKVENPLLWQYGKAYLQFIVRDYTSSLALVRKLEKSVPNRELAGQLQIIKSLTLVARQTPGKAIIPKEVQSVLLENQGHGKFTFALGKELEYLGNTTDAALLFSTLRNPKYFEFPVFNNDVVFWKTTKIWGKTSSTFFTDYYDYVDVVYTPEQVQQMIDSVEANADRKDSFLVYKYEVLKDYIPQLYDLLGTKFIRQNKLQNALAAFEKVGKAYWNRAYTKWDDRDNFFDKNPFFMLKYTPEFIAPADTIRLNKYTVTKQLIYYLSRAEDASEKDRDYYYFLVANAYYNMGREGNVYMMRRMGWWPAQYLTGIEDEPEFRQSNLAKQYYLLARQYAKTKKFKALCLRMVARCEKNRIMYKYVQSGWGKDYEADLASNKYYLELKATYPEYYDDLVSNCDHFKEYFEARR
jgi:hypothetical protein